MRLHTNFFSLSWSLDRRRLPEHSNISLCNHFPVAINGFKYLPILILLCFQAMTISRQDNENFRNQVFVIDFMVKYHGKLVSTSKIVWLIINIDLKVLFHFKTQKMTVLGKISTVHSGVLLCFCLVGESQNGSGEFLKLGRRILHSIGLISQWLYPWAGE